MTPRTPAHAALTPLALLAFAASSVAQIPLQPLEKLPLLDGAADVALADLDEDGVLDLLTTPQISTFGGGVMSGNALRGLGSGDFAAPAAGPNIFSALVGSGDLADLDGDGHLDWVVPNAEAPGQLFVFSGDGSLGFPAPVSVGSSAASTGSAAARIVDLVGGDAFLDVLVLERGVFFGPPVRFNVLIADGLGGYTQVAGPTLTGGPQHFAVGDVDEDGLQDVLVSSTSTNKISIFLATSPSSWVLAEQLMPTAGKPEALELVDLNGDDDLDIVAVDGLGGLLVFAGDGAGGFGPAQASALEGFDARTHLAVGDLDGDGALDVALATRDAVHVFRGAGDGQFSLVNSVLAFVPQGLALGDVDADGDLDIATALNTNPFIGPDEVGLLINRSYPAGSPFSDLGQAHAGSAGLPIQLAEGALTPGSPFAFELFGAVPSGVAFVVVGVSELAAPFKGGTLVPAPDIVRARPVDVDGAASVAGIWGAGSAGTTAFVQWWFDDVGASAGLAGSNAIRVDVP